MPDNLNKLARFWQELKRRRVIHVITVYASAAFVIIELINNLTEPLNLPDNLATIVIVVLAVGFPLVIVFSWLYDLTSKGIELTRSLSEEQEVDKVAVPNVWRIATIVSFIVIVGLVTLNIIGSTKGLRPGDVKSLAILPIDNFTGDDQLDWVAAGMHSSLIGDMGKVSGLRVLGKMTSNAIKASDLSAARIAKENNVQALVETALTCYGDMVCVEVSVITTFPEEKVIWVEEYMEEKSQILNLYKRMARRISEELKVNLTQQDEILLVESVRVDTAAYDAFLKGIYLKELFDPRAQREAIESFKRAIEIEPEWAAPYAMIAGTVAGLRQVGAASDSDMILMYRNLNKALALDPNSVEAHHANAVIAAWTEFDWVKAEKEFLKAIELNPSFERSHMMYAHVLTILRRTEEALYQGKIAQELDPENPFVLGLYWVVLLEAGECQEALYYLEKGLSNNPDHFFLKGRLRDTYMCIGDYDNAFKTMKNNNANNWDNHGITDSLDRVYYEKGWMPFLHELTRMNVEVMHLTPQSRPDLFFERYFLFGKYEDAIDCLEGLYNWDNDNPNWPYFATIKYYDKLKDIPGYLDFLSRFNLAE